MLFENKSSSAAHLQHAPSPRSRFQKCLPLCATKTFCAFVKVMMMMRDVDEATTKTSKNICICRKKYKEKRKEKHKNRTQ